MQRAVGEVIKRCHLGLFWGFFSFVLACFFPHIKYLSRLPFAQIYHRETLHPTDIYVKRHDDPMERQVATDLMSSLMNEWK